MKKSIPPAVVAVIGVAVVALLVLVGIQMTNTSGSAPTPQEELDMRAYRESSAAKSSPPVSEGNAEPQLPKAATDEMAARGQGQ